MNFATIPQDEGEGRDNQDERDSHESDWQEKARAFSGAKMRLYAVQTAVGLLFPLLFWASGWSLGLQGAIASAAPHRWQLVLLFLLIYQALASVISLPLSYYGGFILQHRFGMSRENNRGWFEDWAKGLAIGTVFFLAGAEAYYLLIAALPSSWWWVLAMALTLVTLLITYIAPVLLMPIFYKCSPLEDQEMVRRIQELAGRAGTRISTVCSIDMSRRTVAANAALTGIGRTRMVLLGDTMLQQFSPDEVETVVAHELGHHVHGDIWKGLATEVVGIWVAFFLLQAAVRPVFLSWGLGDISAPALLPLLVLLGELASLVAMPLFNAVSRHYEAEADAFAARLSERPESYAGALYRLAKQNLSELWPPRWVELLLYTHPAIGRRMAAVSAGSEGRNRQG
jgi:STE24 endopeptidase